MFPQTTARVQYGNPCYPCFPKTKSVDFAEAIRTVFKNDGVTGKEIGEELKTIHQVVKEPLKGGSLNAR